MLEKIVPFVAAALAVSLCGCGSGAEFATKYAPDFRREGSTVSVFGIYKDGRMSADAWNGLSPRFATVLGGGACDAAYSDALLANDSALATAIDDQTRSEGVTDELVGLFAPAAAGDVIMLVTVTGYSPSKPTGGKQAPSAPATSPMRGGRRGGRGGGGQMVSPGGEATPREDAFEIAVSLFSVRERRTVGVVAMKSTAKSAEVAMGAFVERLRSELPAAKCSGWKPHVKVDAESVRAVRPSE